MLLIHGKIMSEKETEAALAKTAASIPETLSGEALELDRVLDACERLIDTLPDPPEHLKKFLGSFRKDELIKRVDRELGLKFPDSSLSVAPKGVLLHIAAGNMDMLPAFSVLEGLLTGNINLLKLPSGDNGLSLELLKQLVECEPSLKEYIYVFDTPSTDLDTLQKLMELSDAIVTWGSDDAVSAVRRYAPVNVELIEWGHKLSFCYIRDPNIPDGPLTELARHILDTNQLLCNSCQGIYLDTEDYGVVVEFGRRFSRILEKAEQDFPLPRKIQGKLTLEALTRQLENADGSQTIFQGQRSSVICRQDSNLELSCLYGNIWVKPLPFISVVPSLHKNKSYLQSAGIYPLDTETAHELIKAGITYVCGIDKMSVPDMRLTHDGTFALRRYVKIVEIKS